MIRNGMGKSGYAKVLSSHSGQRIQEKTGDVACTRARLAGSGPARRACVISRGFKC